MSHTTQQQQPMSAKNTPCACRDLEYERVKPGKGTFWGSKPRAVICPLCNCRVVTQTCDKFSGIAHFSAATMCIIGCWPFCLFPYIFANCMNTYHTCPKCIQVIGMHRSL